MKRRRCALAGCGLLGVGAFTLWVCIGGRNGAKAVVAPRYNMVWKELGVLFMRYESESNSTMLLKYLTTEEHRDLVYSRAGHPPQSPAPPSMQPVYRFDSALRTFTQAEAGAWDHATSAVVDCGLAGRGETPFLFKPRTDTLTYAGSAVKTRGRAVQSVVPSPDGKWVAVLSVDGFRLPSFMPFLGRGRVEGTRYHQVFSSATGLPVGDPVALPFDSKFDASHPCWSDDARYIVYPEFSFYFLAIIDGPPTPTQETEP